MRVLVQEGQRLALRADGTQLFQVRGLPGGARPLRRLALTLSGGALLAELDGKPQRLPEIGRASCRERVCGSV